MPFPAATLYAAEDVFPGVTAVPGAGSIGSGAVADPTEETSTLLNGQFSYRGLVFGDGCPIMVHHAEGFEGFDVRQSDSDNPRGDGAIRGIDYVGARVVSLELNIWEPDADGTTYEALWSTIRSTFHPSRTDDSPLIFKRPGQPERVIYCRPVTLTRSESWDTFNRYGYPPVVLRAVDPRIYSTTVRSGIVKPYSAVGGGVDLPGDFPFDWPVTPRVEFMAINNGTADAYPLVRFFGPKSGDVTGVTLTNSTTGSGLEINTAITSGQVLTCDMKAAVTASNGPIVDLDGASKYGAWALPRTVFALAPGSNLLRFEITGSSTDAVCSVVWSDTWIA